MALETGDKFNLRGGSRCSFDSCPYMGNLKFGKRLGWFLVEGDSRASLCSLELATTTTSKKKVLTKKVLCF